MCCHNREQEEQDLVQMGQVRMEEHSGTAEVSTATDEEGAGVTTSGLVGVPTSGLAVEVTIGSRLAGVITTSPKLAVGGTMGSKLAGVEQQQDLLK